MSEVVAHDTAIALISPNLKTMGKQPTGKYYVQLTPIIQFWIIRTFVLSEWVN